MKKPIDELAQLAPEGNPLTAEAHITLSDGVRRTLKFDFEALFILEQLLGKPIFEVFAAPNSFNGLRLYLYAGLHHDAKQRGEDWTPEKVGSLIDLRNVLALFRTVSWAVACSMTGPQAVGGKTLGEFIASAQRTQKNGGPGNGLKR